MSYDDQILKQVRRLNVHRRGERRGPHKPLLLLVAISNLLQGKRNLSFAEVESLLAPLLSTYAPPVKGRHQPELPYWHLRSDQLWEVPGADDFPRQRGGFPRMGALRGSSGHLPKAIADALLSSPTLVQSIVRLLLDAHFPESLHDDIVTAIELTLPEATRVAERLPVYDTTRRRDPKFRERVLRAYEHQCAVTGFRAALGGAYFGCEAAHVQWRAYDGPDTVENGLAMEPTLHKLFDAGAWSLTDDRRY